MRCQRLHATGRHRPTLGVKVEVKNINSFRFLGRAIDYEFDRQVEVVRQGGRVEQETRLWDAEVGRTASMRRKEEAHDYRYFPEPDLPPLVVSDDWVGRIRETLPELPEQRRQRFMRDYDLPAYDAGVLTATGAVAGYFEEVARRSGNPKAASNWVMGEVMRILKAEELDVGSLRVPPEGLAELIGLVDAGTISGSVAKQVFETMVETGQRAPAIVEAEGLTQIDDRGALEEAVLSVMEAHPDAVATYRGGKTGVLGFLVGAGHEGDPG